MKNIIYIAFALLMLNSCGISIQALSFEDEPIVMVFDDISGTKSKLFVKANEWMVSIFKDATSVIEFSDKEEGVIIGKYLMYGTFGTIDTRVYSKIDIRVKDDRARISILPIGSWKYDKSGMTIYTYSKEKAVEDITALIKHFYSAMKAEQIEF
jgi:hypothetical protein